MSIINLHLTADVCEVVNCVDIGECGMTKISVGYFFDQATMILFMGKGKAAKFLKKIKIFGRSFSFAIVNRSRNKWKI